MSPEEMELDASLGPEEGGEAGGKGGGKKKSKLMLIIILVVGMAVLGAGGFFGWRMFFAEKPKPPAEGEKAAGKEGDKAAGKEGDKKVEAAKPGTVINLEPFIVNLADPAGKRYLKLSLAVDAKDAQTKAELEARMPQIRDSILILLTSKSYNDISPVAGKIRLRNEILKIVNRFLGGAGSVHAVYFTEFVVQ